MHSTIGKGSKIYVAGHTGMIGSAVLRALKSRGFTNILTKPRSDLDLISQEAVQQFFANERPEYVIMCAGRTGGIYANNTYRADFLYENVMIDSNLIHASFKYEVKKLVYLSCSSIYPKHCPQPMKEDYILNGKLEETNEPFALAKLAGMKLCESYCRQYGCDFISLIPTNIYGVNQRYIPLNSLMIPALLMRFHEAKECKKDEVVVWGSGRAIRDFMFADDLADAIIFLMENYSSPEPINVGTGREISVKEVAEKIKEIVGFEGAIRFDTSHPEGVYVKLQDLTRIESLGWKSRIRFEDGLKVVYEDFCKKVAGNLVRR